MTSSRDEIERVRWDKRLAGALKNPETYRGPYGSNAIRPSLRTGYIFCETFLAKDIKGKKILDYGCGAGIHSIPLAKAGAFVTGIDISELAIKIAGIRAEKENVSHLCRFVVGNVERMAFPDGSFDLVFNSGTLSCLELNIALHEVCRVLKPDGRFIGIDTLGHNPILNFNRYIKYKRGERTRQVFTHIICTSDLERFKDYFNQVEFKFFDLMTLLAVPFERFPNLHPVVLKLCENVDNLLLSSVFKRYAFKVVFNCSWPKR